jgi:AcrR family transcriptional regulator
LHTFDQVLESAANAILMDGVANLRMGAVTQSVGKPHGGFYGHFVSKDDLVKAAHEWLLALPMRLFDRRAATPYPAAAGVAAYVGYYLPPDPPGHPAQGLPHSRHSW